MNNNNTFQLLLLLILLSSLYMPGKNKKINKNISLILGIAIMIVLLL